MFDHGLEVWDHESFVALQRSAKHSMTSIAASALATAGQICIAVEEVEAALSRLITPVVAPAALDIRAQLRRLVRPGFVTAAGTHRLADIQRYLRGIDRRIEKLTADPVRDKQRMAEVNALEQRYGLLLRRTTATDVTAEMIDVGWMIEELRVSLFAQIVGTPRPVSALRISKELSRLERADG